MGTPNSKFVKVKYDSILADVDQENQNENDKAAKDAGDGVHI